MSQLIKRTSDIVSLEDNDWVAPPRQTRSRASMEKVLRAATTLFTEQGFEETSLADIARASGVSIGSIYNRFAHKQAILLAIMEGYRRVRFEQITEMGRPERWVGKRAEDIVAFHMEIIFGAFRQDGGVLRLMERQRIVNPVIYDQVHRGNALVVSTIARLLEPHAARLAHRDVEGAVRYLHNTIRSAVVWGEIPLTRRPDAPLQAASDAFKREALRMSLAYLGLPTEAADRMEETR